MAKGNITGDNSCREHVPWYDVMRIALYLPLQDPWPQSNREKNIRQILIEGYSKKHHTHTPQKCQGQEKQGKSEKGNSQEEPEETWQVI